jgi:hypothetical protein
MNKQQYLQGVSVLSDPTNKLWHDDVEIATIAMRCAKYKYKKSAQIFTILATLCTLSFILVTWAVQQNTLGAGLELFIVFSSIFVFACIMIEPARDLLHCGNEWDRMENWLRQEIWTKYHK